jgi:hypothetical protein
MFRRRLGRPEEETPFLAAQGTLTAFERAGVLYVRPALVTIIGITG